MTIHNQLQQKLFISNQPTLPLPTPLTPQSPLPAQSYRQYPHAPSQLQRAKRRPLRAPLVILLILLTLLIGLGSIFGSSLFDNVPGMDTPTASAASGPFVNPPLNSAQINAIMHLA